jgi:tRNA threonylcarbamoyladenosine biosynthesis protein TsaB
MILALKTDNPEAEIYLLKNSDIVASKKWHAHKTLSETLLSVCDEMCESAGITLKDLTGLIVFRGPGSFTGLRIGISMMNTLSYTLNIPIAGSEGVEWLSDGAAKLSSNSNQPVIPLYGSDVHITKPRK